MRWKTETYTGWGRALSASGQIARPERAAHAATLSAEAPAIGKRRSYGDAPLNDGGKAVDMTRLDRILDFDPESGLLRVEAGVTLGHLAQLFAPQGWLPPVMPGTGFATVGGAIAMDVHGKNHHIHGSFGQHVTAITIAQNGKTKTLKPGQEMFTATVGGLGQTGIILHATIQMMARKGDVIVVTERRIPNLADFLTHLDKSDATYSVGWVDATATGNALGRGILEEAETGAGLVPSPKRARKVPFNAPRWALSAPIVRAFNNAYYRRVPPDGRTVVKPIAEFFFPLDKIHDWNRLYGKGGFHQFQCVVPLTQTEALREIMRRIAASGLASPLAVLKRMGPGRAGHLSFPMEGYTLAVDFPNRSKTVPLIAALEDATLEAGGRLYLAKDALSTPARLKPMYPELGTWQKAVAKADPEGVLATDLVRRLELRIA